MIKKFSTQKIITKIANSFTSIILKKRKYKKLYLGFSLGFVIILLSSFIVFPSPLSNLSSPIDLYVVGGHMLKDMNIYETQDVSHKLTADISGFVWHDKNGNGIQDGPTEVADVIYNVNVNLVNDQNIIIETTSTDYSGKYSFSNIDPGTYTLEFNKSSTTFDEFTKHDIGTDDNIDSDAGFTGTSADWIATAAFEIVSGGTYDNYDAGLWKYGSIGNYCWQDGNQDGIQDAGEYQLEGVEVELYRASDNALLITDITDTAGVWKMTNISPGEYYLAFTPPATSFNSTLKDVGADDLDSDINNLGVTDDFFLKSEEEIWTLDAGFYVEPPENCDNSSITECDQADLYCDLWDLNEWCTRMPETNSGGSQPVPLCSDGGYAHNISWWSFVAGSEEIELILHTSNCVVPAGDIGIQYGIYTDCSFNETIMCEPACQPPGDVPLIASGLTIGQTYYFFVDGCNGTVCDYWIQILTGGGSVQIIGPSDILCDDNFPDCTNIQTGEEITFSMEDVFNASKYNWTISIDGGSTVDYTSLDSDTTFVFTVAGSYNLCGQGVNECNEGDFYCIDFDVVNGMPYCTNLTNPTNGSVNVDVATDLTWAALGSVTGYKLTIGTTSGGTDIEDHKDVGNVTTYDPGNLPCESEIFVTITPYNGNGDSDDCTEEKFTTESVSANAGLDVTICNGENTQLHAYGGITYKWSPSVGLNNPNISDPIASPASTTTYTVKVSNENGCYDIDDVIVIVNHSPKPNASATNETAENANDCTATCDPTGGVTPYVFTWSNSATTQTITGLAPGNYTVTVTDGNGCSGSETVVVTKYGECPNLSIVSQKINASCYGECDAVLSISSVNNGVAPFSYKWSNGETKNIINKLCAGDYIVTVTDAKSCIAIDTLSITQPDELVINVESIVNIDSLGLGAILLSTNNNGNYVFNWTGPNGFEYDKENLINLKDAGCYTILVTDTLTNCTVDSTICIKNLTSTIDIDNLSEKIGLYPNPTSKDFILDFNGINLNRAKIKLFDLSGKVQIEIDKKANDRIIRFNSDKLNPSLYLIQIQTEYGMIYKKVIVSR